MSRTVKGKAALGIDMAGDELRLVLVEAGEHGISVHSTQTVRPGEDLAKALRALPRRPAAVTCSVSLKDAAIRVLTLPPTTEENLERVVALEA
jgi:hypothetical protein